MKIRDLFEHDVTRDIPPVVYFHEQSPDKLEAEVREYIFTGGIHERYVDLLRCITQSHAALGGPELPAAWISGFYGSGKSSFAKLLGLSLDDARLPDGSKLSDAWLSRDKSGPQLREAWKALLDRIDPIAVVFDIGGIARGDEPIHSAVVRQLQARLDYCNTSSLVASYELKLERDGNYPVFLETVERIFQKPWSELRSMHMVEDHVSAVLHAQFPELYPEPTDWLAAREGQTLDALSAEDAVRAIADMLARRAPSKTLFIVIDEVSQYISRDERRMLDLQSLVSSLGQSLRGKAWLLATGQQQLDDRDDAGVLSKMKDRFPPALRVHLDATTIRDVVHRRLLQKREDKLADLRELYAKHRSNSSLFAYGGASITEEDFVAVYPLLPQHIDLILRITSALRTRSRRAHSDRHAIRGLLQMLGELFRTQRAALTDAEVGGLITIDQIYDVQASALDVDAQTTMARILEFCTEHQDALALRCAKAVALLELLQSDGDNEPTDEKLVASCLYAHLADGDNKPAVRDALELLLDAHLLGYEERTGYKLQSSAGQEWERERQDISVPAEDLSELVMDALRMLIADSKPHPQLGARSFPWQGLFTSEATHHEHKFVSGRESTAIVADFRLLLGDRQSRTDWTNRSSEPALRDRIIWIAGASRAVLDKARQIAKSKRMVARYTSTRASLSPPRRQLLREEEARVDSSLRALEKLVAEAFMGGRLYFRGADTNPHEHGASFASALSKFGSARLPTIYSHFIDTNVTNGELEQLLQRDLSGPSIKFYADDLGILGTDAGRIVPVCNGTVPQRVFELIQREPGITGHAMLRRFGEPPYGYPDNVVKACVAGLLRASKIRVHTNDGKITSISSIIDPGVQDLFRRERDFNKAEISAAGEARIKPQDRYRIVELFEIVFHTRVEPENDAIADALDHVIQPNHRQLWELEKRLDRLPGDPSTPEVLAKLHRAFEDCLRSRQVEPRVLAVIQHLATLRDGVTRLDALRSELSDEAVEAVRTARAVTDTQLRQLIDAGELDAKLHDAARRIDEQLRSNEPWLRIDAITPDLELVRTTYRQRRLALLNKQEQLAEATREQIEQISGFETLDADHRHAILRPIKQALRETSEHETQPPLAGLLDGVQPLLDAARESASVAIDAVSVEAGVLTVRVDIGVRDRLIHSSEDVDRLLDEIRTRLLAQLDKPGHDVRLRLR